MSWQSWIQNLLGSGLVGLIFVAYMKYGFDKKARQATFEFEKDAREAAFLKQQLDKLYGPVRFYVSKAKVCFDMSERFVDVCENMEDDDEDLQVAWEKVSQYFQQLDEFSHKIDEILQENFAYLDVEDLPIFHEFVELDMRWKTERKKGRVASVGYSDAIRDKVGRFEFATFVVFSDTVTERFAAKQKRLRELGGSN